MATEEYVAFENNWIPFNEANILIAWDIGKSGSSYYLEVIIYQPHDKEIVKETVRIHKKDFESWVQYMDTYIHFDVYRDRLLYIEHKWEEHWINLSWEDVQSAS